MRAAAATLRLLPRAALRLPARPSGITRGRLLAATLIALAIGSLYQFWFRDSSLVRVEHVTVTGLDTPDAGRVRAELTAAARRMTTLDLDEGALRHAVAAEPIVHSLRLHPSFPHGLRIEVVENRPVAMLTAAGRQVAVAPDGTLLDGARLSQSLPAIRLRGLPTGARLESPSVRQLVAVAASAPGPLLGRIASVNRESAHGLVASLRRGPAIWFGSPAALATKWESAVTVLARRSSQGASYIDVRMPSRPVAGGLSLSQPPQADAQNGVISAAPVEAPGMPPPPISPPGVTPSATGPTVAQPGPTTAQPAPAGATPAGAATGPAAPAQTQSTPQGGVAGATPNSRP
jgi:cell division protein FtsQ